MKLTPNVFPDFWRNVLPQFLVSKSVDLGYVGR